MISVENIYPFKVDDDAKPQEKPPNKSTVDEVKVPAAKEKWTLVKSSNKSPKIQTGMVLL